MRKLITVLIIAVLCFSSVFAEKQTPIYNIKINAASRTLRLYDKEALIKEYPIAAGKPATKSPLGSFTIVNKAINPSWNNKATGKIVPPGPQNPLGIRWLGISAPKGTYGIHGNNVPSSIGTFASGGCIRMYNNDVQELYSIINVKTPVQISYECVEVKQDPYSNNWTLIVYPDTYRLKNSAALIKKLASEHKEINTILIEKASALITKSITKPVAVSEGTAVLLNNQFITNDAFYEGKELYLYYLAAYESLGLDSNLISDLAIPVIEKNERIYVNVSKALAQLGGSLTIDMEHNNVYISMSMVKVNGRLLGSYTGGFDKEYMIETAAFEKLRSPMVINANQVDIRDLCRKQGWSFGIASISKTVEIHIPMKIKIAEEVFTPVSYNGRYFIDCSSAAKIPEIQSANLKVYSNNNQDYYDVYEIMEAYEYQADAFMTLLEVFSPINVEI